MSYSIANNEIEKASKIFTDRQDSRTAFWNNISYVEKHRNESKIKVLNFYGMGGIGKSSLCKKIESELTSDHPDIKYVYYDFEWGIDEKLVLYKIKNDLIDRYHFKFPLLECALYYCELKMRETTDTYEPIEGILEGNPTLSAIFDAIGNVPVLGSIAAVLKAADTTLKIARKIRNNTVLKKYVNEMEVLEAKELYKLLPKYFAEDMKNNFQGGNEIFVVILDSYEAEVNETNSIGNPLNNDLWLRGACLNEEGIILRIPNTLWVVAGRESLKWPTIDKNWDENVLEQHLLGVLSYTDAEYFLNHAGIYDKKIIRQIYSISKGIPFHLDICVDHYNQMYSRGETPTEGDFDQVIDQMVSRVVQYMDDDKKEMLYYMVCLNQWTDVSYFEVMKKMGIAANRITYMQMTKLSFVVSNENCYSISKDIRDALLKSCPNVILNQYLNYLKHEEENSIKDKNDIRKSILRVEYNSSIDKKEYTLPDINLSENQCEIIYEILDNMLKIYALKEFEEFFSPIWKMYCNNISTKHSIVLCTYYIRYLLMKGEYVNAYEISKTIDNNLCSSMDKEYRSFLEQKSNSCYYAGKYSDSLQIDAMLYEWYNQLSEDHPIEAMKASNRLAITYIALGHYDKALTLCNKAIHDPDSVNDNNRIYWIQALNNMATCFFYKGSYIEALKCYQQAYERLVIIKGENHNEVLKVLNNEATLYNAMKEYGRALDIYQKIYSKYAENLGEDHPYTLTAYMNIASCLYNMSRYEEAYVIYDQLYKIRTETLGIIHPDTIAVKFYLARLKFMNDRKNEGIEEMNEVYEYRSKLFGEDHQETKRALRNLEEMHRKNR